MSSARERAALEGVRREEALVRSALLALATGSDRDSALVHLEATYTLRMFAEFERLLRARASATEDETLVNLVQRLVRASGRSATTKDPVPPHLALPWWQLLARDRNRLMHGRERFPRLTLDATSRLMVRFFDTLDG